MHLIVVRHDLTGFQHLHPVMAVDGTWSVPLRVADAGSYRVFADFSRDNTPRRPPPTCASTAAPTCSRFPAPAQAATSDGGYAVRLDSGAAHAGDESAAALHDHEETAVPSRTQPYLGAGGHLVALRDGDLAFLHVHPSGNSTEFDGRPSPRPAPYRLFLQFQVDGAVQTVAFTEDVS